MSNRRNHVTCGQARTSSPNAVLALCRATACAVAAAFPAVAGAGASEGAPAFVRAVLDNVIHLFADEGSPVLGLLAWTATAGLGLSMSLWLPAAICAAGLLLACVVGRPSTDRTTGPVMHS